MTCIHRVANLIEKSRFRSLDNRPETSMSRVTAMDQKPYKGSLQHFSRVPHVSVCHLKATSPNHNILFGFSAH